MDITNRAPLPFTLFTELFLLSFCFAGLYVMFDLRLVCFYLLVVKKQALFFGSLSVIFFEKVVLACIAYTIVLNRGYIMIYRY